MITDRKQKTCYREKACIRKLSMCYYCTTKTAKLCIWWISQLNQTTSRFVQDWLLTVFHTSVWRTRIPFSMFRSRELRRQPPFIKQPVNLREPGCSTALYISRLRPTYWTLPSRIMLGSKTSYVLGIFLCYRENCHIFGITYSHVAHQVWFVV